MRADPARFRGIRTITVGAILGGVWWLPRPALAVSDSERAAARDAANEGGDAFEQKRWADVVDRFGRAESLVHSPVHLLFIARAQVQLGKLVEAYEAYTKVSREVVAAGAPAAFAAAQRDGAKELEELEPRVPRMTVVVEGAARAPVEVTVDGAAVPTALIGLSQRANPGEHQLQAKSEGLASDVTTVTLAEGAKERVVLTLKPAAGAGAAPVVGPAPGGEPVKDEPPAADSGGGSSGMRIGAYVAFGVGAVGIAGGTIFALQSSGKRGDADDLCNGPGGKCPVDSKSKIAGLDDDASSASTLSLVSFAVGGVGIGTGVALLLMSSGGSKESPPSASVTPWVGLGSAGVRGRF